MANRLNIDVYKNPPIKTKYFPAFDGVDFVSPYTNISEKHSPKMVNMYRDYTENGGGRLRTRPFTELTAVNYYPYNEGQYPIVYNNKLLIRSGVSLKDYSAIQFKKNNDVFIREAGESHIDSKYVNGDFHYYFEHKGGKGKLLIKDVDGTEKKVFDFGNDTEYKSYTGKWYMMGGPYATFTFTGDSTSGDETYSIRSFVVNDKYVKEVSGVSAIDTFVSEQSSDKMNVEYGNKLYFYEKNINNMGDVYIYDGTSISRFSDILSSYTAGFESSGYYYTSTFKYPIKYSDQNKRYTSSDYTLADAMAADLHVFKKTTLSDEQMQKYDFKIPDDNINNTVELSDAMIINQIVAGKYKEKKQYFTQEDIELVEKYISNTIEFSEEQKRKYNVTQDYETIDGVIVDKVDADDLNAIKGYVSARQMSLTKLPLEIAPMTYINANKYGAGEAYERINLLSPYFIVQYLGDGTSTEFALPLETAVAKRWQAETINTEQATSTLLTGQNVGTVKLSPAPADGLRFYVLCKMSSAEYEKNSRIVADMSIAQIFDNRVFMAGATGEYINRVIHSGIDNLLYFPDNASYEDIMGSGDVTALLPVKSQLAVIKNDISGQAAVYLHTPTATENELNPKIYPSTYGMFDKGCVNKDCYAIFNGEAVFLSKDGLMAISSLDLSDERSLSPRSTAVNSILCSYDLSKARITVWQNYLVVAVGNKMFLADGNKRTRNSDTQAYEYEWYYWENLGIGHLNWTDYLYGGEILSLVAAGDVLYYTLRDDANIITVQIDGNIRDNRYYRDFTAVGENETPVNLPVYSYITTPYISFGYPQYFKSCVRRGNAANIEGKNINVYSYSDLKQYGNIVKNTNYTNELLPYYSIDNNMLPVESVHKNNVLIFRPADRRWLNISFMFYSEEPMKFYDATIQAQINNTVNNI